MFKLRIFWLQVVLFRLAAARRLLARKKPVMEMQSDNDTSFVGYK